MPLPRLLILPALAALFALALTASPASAQNGACPCAADFPLESPDLCYERPGAAIGDFAYVAPSDFLQVVGFGPAGGYCRHNATFQWEDAAGVAACAAFVGCACNTPTFGAEICANGIDDDCDGSVDTIAGQRFEDRGLTVYDCQTGLEWQKTTDDGTVRDKDNTYTWSDGSSWDPNGTAFTSFLPYVAAALGGMVCNHDDWSCTSGDGSSTTCTPAPSGGCWRVPEIDELRTILSAQFPGCTSSPCIVPIFGPTASSVYWSATSVEDDPKFAREVSFTDAVVGVGTKNGGGRHVRAVRSGP